MSVVIDEFIKKFISGHSTVIRLIRADYWPLIETNPDYQFEKVGNELLFELLSICQAFGFISGTIVELDTDVHINGVSAEKYVGRFQSNCEPADLNTVLKVGRRYADVLQNFGLIDLGLERLIRIKSLFDVNIDPFDNIEEFVDFLITNIVFQIEHFGKDNYVGSLLETSELPVIQNGIYPTLCLPKTGWHKVCNFLYKNKEYQLEIGSVPGYSPLGVIYMARVHSEIPNYFSMASFQRYSKKGNSVTTVLTCLQYNFVNLLIDQFSSLVVAEEVNHAENLRFMEKSEEERFRQSLREVKGENFMNVFLKIVVSDICKKHDIEKLEIISPMENHWLFEHNKNRSMESLLKSGYNLYTKIGEEFGGTKNEMDRMVLDTTAFKQWEMEES